MTNEVRLIDANALSEKIGKMKDEITHNRGGYRYCNEDEKNEWDKLDGFDSLVCDAPTVDAVEVVRCKDCIHRHYVDMGDEIGAIGGCRLFGTPMMTCNDFCSYGERREGE